jgi:hypothetical protein
VLARGQRIGMIKFGSRTELYVAKWLDPQVRVKVGQKVRGASTWWWCWASRSTPSTAWWTTRSSSRSRRGGTPA